MSRVSNQQTRKIPTYDAVIKIPSLIYQKISYLSRTKSTNKEKQFTYDNLKNTHNTYQDNGI